MGSMRSEKERANMLQRQRREAEVLRHRVELDSAVLELEMKLLTIQREIDLKRGELLMRSQFVEAQAEDEALDEAAVRERRGGGDDEHDDA